jgi:hypothetical protein
MHRQKVMQLLASYVEVVTSASTTCECPETQREYEERARSGKQLLSRWREGCPEDYLKGALMLELGLYESARLSGPEAEYVGRAFGELCRAVRVAGRWGVK